MTTDDDPPELSPSERERYSRQTLLELFRPHGQRTLRDSSVLVVGAGGLGSAALPYLAGAGVGMLGIVDGDKVELANLPRQVLHTELGHNKANSAAERLRLLNPHITVTAYPQMLTSKLADDLFPDYDVIVDCTDTFAAKFLVSDAASRAKRPLIWAAAVGTVGQCSVFGVPDRDGNRLYLRDLIPAEPPPHSYQMSDAIGVLGPLVGQVGALQATETIKVLLGRGDPLVGRVAVLNGRTSRWEELPIRRSPRVGNSAEERPQC